MKTGTLVKMICVFISIDYASALLEGASCASTTGPADDGFDSTCADATLSCARKLEVRDINTPNARENVCVKTSKCTATFDSGGVSLPEPVYVPRAIINDNTYPTGVSGGVLAD